MLEPMYNLNTWALDRKKRRYREALEACRLPRRRCGGLTPAAPYPTETTLLGAIGTRCLSHP